MKRLRDFLFYGIPGIVFGTLFIVIVLAVLATISVVRWMLLVSTQLVASLGLNHRQRVIMLGICSFVSVRDDESEARFIGRLMWEPGDHGPHRPYWLIDKLEERRRQRFQRLAEARRAGISAWRIRLARCVS